jgi:hypothetical protein
MAVYVDDVRFRFGRMVMCHMWADTDAELHAMARKIGMQRSWFQCPPKASWNHYDVSLSSKKKAIDLGAVLTDRFGAVEHRAHQTGDAATIERITKVRARRSQA